MLRCFHAGSYLHFLRRPAAPALLIAVVLAFGCDGGLLVEGPIERQVGASSALEPVAGPQTKLGDHDPEAKVYELLRPKAEVLAELKSGQCLTHFARAGSDKFTPLPFALDWPQGEPAVEDGKTPAVAIVGRLRGERSVLRVLCLFPNTDWHRGVLAKLFEEQLAKPPFKQDADGWLRVRDEWKGSESASASVAPDLGKELSPSPSGSGPVRLGRSAGPCHLNIVWDPDSEEWVLMHQCPPLVACGIGLDWDEASGTCVPVGGTSTPTVPPAPPPPAPPGEPTGGSSGTTGPGDPGDNGDDDGEEPTTQELALECSSPTRGAEGTCSVTVTGGDVTLGSLSYDWSAGSASSTAGSSWSGTATGTRQVAVNVTNADEVTPLSATATVNPRAGGWQWQPADDLGQRSISASCFGGALGLTMGPASVGCTSVRFFDYLNGFTVGGGSGPWADQWYVTSHNDTRAGAYWDSSPELGASGTTYDTSTLPTKIRSECRGEANTAQVNACSALASREVDRTSGAFDALVREVENHEGEHVQAVIDASKSNDGWRAWESVVAGSESGANTMAQTAGAAVNTALLNATLAVDSDYDRQRFDVWWWVENQWERINIRTGHNR